MVNLITLTEDNLLLNEYKEGLLNELSKNNISGGCVSIVHSVSKARANVAKAETFSVLHGKEYIEEGLGGYRFKITPFSFFQTNTKQCEKLFNKVVELGNFTKEDNVLDLYCGCGAISIFISGHVKSVHGAELSRDSINSAAENTLLNNISNCSFQNADVKDFLGNLVKLNNKEYDTIILDPPRSGIHPKSAEYLLQIEPRKIIYVSCNPSTQARDLKLLSEKFSITAIQPVDMFPHTFHIENIVRLDLKK
jgi:23S rRNA (uracil1939-C5)-methyltransferase